MGNQQIIKGTTADYSCAGRVFRVTVVSVAALADGEVYIISAVGALTKVKVDQLRNVKPPSAAFRAVSAKL